MLPEHPTADWSDTDPTALSLIPIRIAKRYRVFPMRHDAGELVVATSTPDDLGLERDLEFASGRRVRFEEASDDAISAALRTLKDEDPEIRRRDGTPVWTGQDDDPESVEAPPAIVGILRAGLEEAVALGASDIHIEPTDDGAVIRIRIDGVLQRFAHADRALVTRAISRIKVVAGLDITERRQPQDGRVTHGIGGRDVDLRVSVLPTREGEKAVIRVLNATGVRPLSSLGLLLPERERLDALLAQHTGVIVVTGPTGSGKTTTLFAALQSLNAETTNISTVEDPIELRLPGITQTQVESAAGLTFGVVLRSMLRQDPDVILVGELRDAETVSVAVQAANTGHLVLTTLHTNDAASAIPRLLDLGARRSDVADTVRGIVAQRLVRRLCDSCARPASPEQQDSAVAARFGIVPRRVAVGCAACRETGYRGRVAVVEILTVSPAIADALREGAAPADVRNRSRAEGARPMLVVAADLVAQGITSLDEVARVFDPPALPLAGSEATGTAPASAAGASVLLANHDAADLLAWERAFAAAGWRVTTALDGTEAARALGSRSFDCLVLRLRLPQKTGRELLVERRLAGDRTPAVVVTNLDDTAVERLVLAEGAQDYLRLPVDSVRLERRCRMLVFGQEAEE